MTLTAVGGTLSTVGGTIAGLADLLAFDTFDRADNATTLGTADTGQVWEAVSGTWGIQSNRAYSSTAFQAVAVVDTGTADCTVKVQMPALGDGGFAFRVVDAQNGWVWANGSSDSSLYKQVAGAYTQVAAAGPGTAGDVLEAVLSGSSIIVKRNGAQIVSVTDSALQAATKHGIRTNQATVRLDNFEVSAP